VRDSALDGKDCKLLNEDWLLLEHDDLEAQPPVWNVNGSKYFRSLAEGISKMSGSHELLVALGRTAICTRNYAQAMRELRKGPAAIRESEGGMVGTHKRFEAHARTFVLRWIESGETLKGYGWHLWTSLITLFRRYGCLELIIVMEPEEAIFTELQMEMLFAEYEILPYTQKLMDEYREYYRLFPLRRRGDVDDLRPRSLGGACMIVDPESYNKRLGVLRPGSLGPA